MPETLRQEYRQFLAKSFCGLRLRRPLFYNWKYGLRIDLQDESILLRDIELRGSAYFEEVTRRAGLIFKDAFDVSDDVIFIYMDLVDKRGRIRFHNYAFRQIDGLRKDEVQFTNERNLYTHIYGVAGKHQVALIKVKTARINYKNILTAIAHKDFPGKYPRFDEKGAFSEKDVYFINVSKKLIYNMYDDRGLDIIAADKETLRPIYEKYPNLILDYDREKMDQLFEG